VAYGGRQVGYEAMSLLRGLEFHQRLNRVLDFLQAPGKLLTQDFRILLEGFRDHLPVEEQVDAPFADLEQIFRVHVRGPHVTCRPRSLPS